MWFSLTLNLVLLTNVVNLHDQTSPEFSVSLLLLHFCFFRRFFLVVRAVSPHDRKMQKQQHCSTALVKDPCRLTSPSRNPNSQEKIHSHLSLIILEHREGEGDGRTRRVGIGIGHGNRNVQWRARKPDNGDAV